jgi:hypothetical protein
MATEIIEVFNAPTDVVEVLVAGPIGPQANINYIVVSSSQAVSNRQLIAANTLAGSFTLTLPSNPAAGDAIDIFDYSDTFDTNPLTIGRNGQNIESLAEDLTANVEGAYFTLIFTGDSRGWQVVPRYGVAGVNSVSGTAPIVSSGGTTPTLSITAATTSAAGSMSSADKTKLDGIATGAEVNVQANWTESNNALDSFILNKPATFTPSSHTHGNITNDGKVGAVSGLPVVTTTDGAVTTLALGTANQVLRVNSGATGVEFGAGFDAASPPAIGSTTPNTGAFTTLSSNVGTITASTPLAVTQTWNNSAVNFRAIETNITNTASQTESYHLACRVGGSTVAYIRRDGRIVGGGAVYGGNGLESALLPQGVAVGNAAYIGFCSNTYANDVGGDLRLFRDAADTLAQRRTTNPQTFRLYNTYINASNYERGFMRWTSNVLQIGTEKAGTGSARNLELLVGGVVAMRFATSAQFDLVGTLRPVNNNVYSLGVNTRRWTSILLTNSVYFGDTTSASDPQIKKSGTTLQVKLADDSAFTAIAAGNLVLTDNTGAETATFDAQAKLTDNRTYDLPDSSGTIALLETLPAGGTKTYTTFTATDNQPPAADFATLDTRNSIAVLDFDDATDESAVFVSIIPEGASLGSGLKIRLHWMASTATSGDVVWDVSLERMTTDLDSDSFDTIASGTAAANGTSGILTVTEITLTTIDSVTAGDGYRLKITRDADNGSDSMSGDAELVVCEVRSAA